MSPPEAPTIQQPGLDELVKQVASILVRGKNNNEEQQNDGQTSPQAKP